MISNAFRYNAGLIRANGMPFFTGDGSTSSAQLVDRHGNPISSDRVKRVDAIHRTDWQGRQLLYTTARTNIEHWSQDYTNAAWAKNACTATAATWTAPDGSNTGQTLTESSGGTLHRIQQNQTATNGATYTVSCYAKAGARNWILLGEDSNSGSACFDVLNGAIGKIVNSSIPVITAMGGGVYRCSVSFAQLGTIGRYFVGLCNYNGSQIYAGDGASGCGVWGFQVETGSVATGYIPTTTAAVTVTDYTLSGSTVNFGQVPASGAVCDWTGVARR